MTQLTFSELDFKHKKRKTRREVFLEKMDNVIPWSQLEKEIHRYYPKAGKGRRPYPLSTMLRIHCLQLFYNLSDPAMEDALYEIESMRQFAGLRLSGNIPDETTILNFRHLLEQHKLGETLFGVINRTLSDEGLMLREGTIVDATIISAPSSTKNQSGARDEEMSSTRKGNQSYFGMKMHIGTDSALGCIHSIETTGANVHDITVADKLLHGDEQRVWGDAGYVGIDKREEHTDRDTEWFIACRPGQLRGLPKRSDKRATERLKAQVRSKVEHPFLYIKRIFGYSKARYKGLAKNHNRLCLLAGFYNLIRVDRLVC